MGPFFCVRRAVRGTINHFPSSIITLLLITASFLAFSAHCIILYNLNHFKECKEENIRVTAYLVGELPEKEILSIQKNIEGLREVAGIIYISREEALKILLESAKEENLFLPSPNNNPLPASIEILMKKKYRSPDSLKNLVANLGKLEGINEVDYHQKWMENYFLLSDYWKKGSAITTGSFSLLVFFVITVAARLSLYPRKEEWETMRLMGASGFYLEAPFCFEGLIKGLLGSAIALGILFALYGFCLLLKKSLIFSSIFQIQITFFFLPLEAIGEIIILGIIFGGLGSLIASSKL